MFSNTTKYAIKAVLYLAINSNTEKRVVISEIANSINVPQAYIAKLLQELSRKNIISSLRGPNGGFFLSIKTIPPPSSSIIMSTVGAG